MAQMEYRFNFIGNLAMETGYLLVKLSYVVVVYRSGVKINGLSPDEILLFIGTFVTLTAVYAGLFMINNFGLRSKIKDGDLDLLLTKPVSLQFMATLRQADLTIFSVDAHRRAGSWSSIAWARLGIPVTLATVGGYAGFLADQRGGQLQPVPAAADPVLLADEHQRHRGDHRFVLGFQQHADGYLHRDQADRRVHPADLRHHQLSAHVPAEQDAARLSGLGHFPAHLAADVCAPVVEARVEIVCQRLQLIFLGSL